MTTVNGIRLATHGLIWGEAYHKYVDRVGYGVNPCACCGRPVENADRGWWIEVIDGGEFIVAAGAVTHEMETDRGYMGFYPIGARCARKFPKAFLQRFGRDAE